MRKSALRALELNPELPEAHGMLGVVAGLYESNWPEAERRFRLALARPPVSWHVRAWYSVFYLLPVGRAEDALREVQHVLEDNPLSQITWWNRGVVLENLERPEEAQAAHQRSIEIDPAFWVGWASLGALHLQRRQLSTVLECTEKALAIFPSPLTIGTMAAVLQLIGDHSRARETLNRLPLGVHGAVPARAFFHLGLGDVDAALGWADKSIDEPYTTLISSLLRPKEAWLRQSARWPAVMKKLNLPA